MSNYNLQVVEYGSGRPWPTELLGRRYSYFGVTFFHRSPFHSKFQDGGASSGENSLLRDLHSLEILTARCATVLGR